MNARSKIALEKFSDGYNCAQSVLYAFSEDLPIDGDTALRLACGFGAGIARRQELCGAVSGGIMAISLLHGRGEGQDRTVTEDTYRRVEDLMCRFETAQGSCVCRSLVEGCDLTTAEGKARFRENDLLNKVCVRCVALAVSLVEEILFE